MVNEKDGGRKAGDPALDSIVSAGVGATESARSALDEVVQAARATAAETVRAGSEAAETARRTADAAGRTSEDATRRFGQFFAVSARASEDMAQRTQQTLDAMVQTGSVLGDGMQAIAREWADYAQGAMQRQLDSVNELMRARNVQDVLGLQADRLRKEMELLLGTSAKVSERAARVTSEAYVRLHDKADRAA
jgi:hypothetical protein